VWNWLRFNKGKAFYLSKCKEHFLEYKKTYLIIISISLIGAIFGVITIVNTSTTIVVTSITDYTLLIFLEGESSFFGFIFVKILFFTFYLGLIYINIYSVYVIPLNAFIVLLFTYNSFLNIAIFVSALGFFGILNTIIVIIPVSLLSIILLIIFSSVVMKMSYMNYKCTSSIPCKNPFNFLFKLGLNLVGCYSIVIIYEGIMLSILSNKFLIT